MNLSRTDIEQLANTGLDAGLAAADYINSQASSKHKTELKTGIQSFATQVVTEIDIKSQAIILEVLRPCIHHYDLGWISEEDNDNGSRFQKEYFWCIDPLDGTLPYTENRHGYAVSIALLNKAGDVIIGVVVDPLEQEHYVAIKGMGCTKNGIPFISNAKYDGDLVCFFDRSFIASDEYHKTLELLNQLRDRMGLNELQIRSGAGAVMNALGLLDVKHGCYLKLAKPSLGGGCIWDFASTSLIFNELGWHITDNNGKSLMLNKKESAYMNKEGIIFATDSNIGRELVQLASIVSKQ